MELVIGLTGEKGAGKSMAAGYLAQMYQANIVCARDVLTEVAKVLSLPPTRDVFIRLADALRNGFHTEVIVEAMIARAGTGGNLVVLDSIRTWEGQLMAAKLPGYRLVAITAPAETRWQRTRARPEKPDEKDQSFEQFTAVEQGRTERDIPGLVAKAAVRCENVGTVDELRKRLFEMMKAFGCTPFPRYSRR